MPVRWMQEIPYASRLLTLCARTLGEKRITAVDGCTMTGYLWRGCLYVTKLEFAESPRTIPGQVPDQKRPK